MDATVSSAVRCLELFELAGEDPVALIRDRKCALELLGLQIYAESGPQSGTA